MHKQRRPGKLGLRGKLQSARDRCSKAMGSNQHELMLWRLLKKSLSGQRAKQS